MDRMDVMDAMSGCEFVSEFVTLRGGLIVPLPAVQLALNLEARGLHLRPDGDALLIGPRELLTDEDREAVRHWKPHLLALLAYDADSQGRPQ